MHRTPILFVKNSIILRFYQILVRAELQQCCGSVMFHPGSRILTKMRHTHQTIPYLPFYCYLRFTSASFRIQGQ
jgi:hypothetical protein